MASTIPVQDRLVAIEPAVASVTMSWYTTAMYVGIALAPPVGTMVQSLTGPSALAFVGAGLSLFAFTAFQVGFRKVRVEARAGACPVVGAIRPTCKAGTGGHNS